MSLFFLDATAFKATPLQHTCTAATSRCQSESADRQHETTASTSHTKPSILPQNGIVTTRYLVCYVLLYYPTLQNMIYTSMTLSISFSTYGYCWTRTVLFSALCSSTCKSCIALYEIVPLLFFARILAFLNSCNKETFLFAKPVSEVQSQALGTRDHPPNPTDTSNKGPD